MTSILPQGKQYYPKADGTPMVGGKVYTFDTATSNPRPTYADINKTSQNANPVILDARGEAKIFWDGIYRVILKDSLDNTVWTVDDVAADQAHVQSTAIVYALTGAEAVAGVTPTNFSYPPGDVRRYGADPTGTADSSSAFTQALSCNFYVWARADQTNLAASVSTSYRLDSPAILNRDFTAFFIDGGVTLIKKAAFTASTRPVVRVTGNYCSVIGNGPSSTIQSENAAPHGVLLWGSENPGDVGGSDIVNSRQFLCQNLRVRAKDAAGSQLTLALLSSQAFSSGALYDGIFNNLVLVGGEKQLYLNPDVAGNTFCNINFFETRGYSLYLDGAPASITDCQFVNFFSDAAVSNITSYYGRNVNRCTFSNMGGEPGGGTYVDFDSSCSALKWDGYDNHPSNGVWAAGGSTYMANGVTRLKSISFPATAVADPDPNTLDDYEEGTFTPTAAGTTVAGAGTYTSQSGRYTKIGDRVLFSVNLDWTAHTGTGNLKLSGLPFTSNASLPFCPVAMRISGLAMTAGNYAQGYIFNNTTDITLEQIPTGGGAAAAVPMDAVATVAISGEYRV